MSTNLNTLCRCGHRLGEHAAGDFGEGILPCLHEATECPCEAFRPTRRRVQAIQVRCHPAEHDRFVQAARNKGMSLSSWIRESLIRVAAASKKTPANPPVSEECKACAVRTKAGFEGLCPACASERARTVATPAPVVIRAWEPSPCSLCANMTNQIWGCESCNAQVCTDCRDEHGGTTDKVSGAWFCHKCSDPHAPLYPPR